MSTTCVSNASHYTRVRLTFTSNHGAPSFAPTFYIQPSFAFCATHFICASVMSYSDSPYISSCFIKPWFGRTIGRNCCRRRTASAGAIVSLRITVDDVSSVSRFKYLAGKGPRTVSSYNSSTPRTPGSTMHQYPTPLRRMLVVTPQSQRLFDKLIRLRKIYCHILDMASNNILAIENSPMTLSNVPGQDNH